MRRKIFKAFLLFLLMMPIYVNAADYLVCGNGRKLPLVLGTGVSTVYVIIRIIVPVLFVITGMVSFFKVTLSSKVEEELQKAKKSLVNRIIAAIIIFFIASIVNFVISLAVGKNNNFSSCMYCMLHSDKCEHIDGEIVKLCPGLLSDQVDYDENCVYFGNRKGRVNYSNTGNSGIPNSAVGSGNSSSASSGVFTGWKQYDSSWGSVTMGPSRTTLKSAGCTTTSLAILMAKSGAVTDMSNFSPVTLAKTLQYSGSGCMKYWDDYNSWKSYAPSFRFVGQYSLSGSASNKANTIKNFLDEGKYVMIVVRNGGHYVAADRVEGNIVYIHDPGCEATDLFKTYKASGVNTILVYKREV